jgi:hypothetical protein
MQRLYLWSLFLWIWILAGMLYSQAPPTLSYQGMLTGSGDEAVEDGIYEMHFSLYTETEPSTSLWSETHGVTVVKGVFNVILGTVNPLELPFDDQYYLGIAVGEGSELSPRIALTSSAYSLRARSIDDGSITTKKLADDAVTASKLHDMGASSGQLLRWSGSIWEPVNAGESKWSETGYDIYYENGNVGIGKNDPGQALDVEGNIEVSGWIGTVGEAPVEIHVNNERVLRIEPAFYSNLFLPNVVAGAPTNHIEGVDISGATIGGGYGNTARSSNTTIGGGIQNAASGERSTIGGGYGNVAGGEVSTVGGGTSNSASSTGATIGGGAFNQAEGYAATIPGGSNNRAIGDHSFAAGLSAKADHNGSFVWADETFSNFVSTGENQFLIRAGGGVGIGTNNPGGFMLAVNGDAAKPGGGSWSNFSDKRLKRNIEPIESGILDELLTLRGYTFEYLDHAIECRLALPGRQVGLIAQEVMEVFPEWVDTDDEGYLYITERGTTAIFVEALRELRKEKDSEIYELRSEKDNEIHKLQQRMEYLEQLVLQQAAVNSGSEN